MLSTFKYKGICIKDINGNIVKLNCNIEDSIICDLMSIDEFAANVDSQFFIPYDGHVCSIIIDGYLSNFTIPRFGGTIHPTISGTVKTTIDELVELGKKYEVKVDWVNK